MYLDRSSSFSLARSFIEFFNEPTDSYTAMSAAQLASFLGRHAGPLFEKRGLWPSTKLSYGGQAERHSAHQFVPAVLADKDAAKYSDVIAYHGYDCQLSVRDNPKSNCSAARENYALVADLRARFPSRPLWMTEICYAYNGDDPNCTKSATLGACTDYPRDPTLAPPLPRRDFAGRVTWGHEVSFGASDVGAATPETPKRHIFFEPRSPTDTDGFSPTPSMQDRPMTGGAPTPTPSMRFSPSHDDLYAAPAPAYTPGRTPGTPGVRWSDDIRGATPTPSMAYSRAATPGTPTPSMACSPDEMQDDDDDSMATAAQAIQEDSPPWRTLDDDEGAFSPTPSMADRPEPVTGGAPPEPDGKGM